jgi:excisionase family DNA binding protein
MTSKQVAEKLKVSTRRVRALLESGRFPGAVREGRDWLVPNSAVESFQPRESGYRGHIREKRGPKPHVTKPQEPTP